MDVSWRLVYTCTWRKRHIYIVGGGLIFHNFPLNIFLMLGSSYFKHLSLHQYFLTIVVYVVLQLLSKGTQRLLKIVYVYLLVAKLSWLNVLFILIWFFICLIYKSLIFFKFFIFYYKFIIIKAFRTCNFLIDIFWNVSLLKYFLTNRRLIFYL